MKKLTLIVSALAIVLGLSQCAKKPNMPVFNGGYEGVTKEITFSTGASNGSKASIDNTVIKELKFYWEAGDVIHVYGSQTGDFTEGKYCGELKLVSGSGSQDGVFKGTLENLPTAVGTSKLRFYYFGSGNRTATVDFSTQDGKIGDEATSLKNKIVAMVEEALSDNSDYNRDLEVLYSIIKFDLSQFAPLSGTCDLAMTGTKNISFNVDDKGDVIPVAGSTTTLKGISSNSDKYYVAVMPEDVARLDFSINGRIGCKKDLSLAANIFYTLNGEGQSIVVDATWDASVVTLPVCGIYASRSSYGGKITGTNVEEQGVCWIAAGGEDPTINDNKYIQNYGPKNDVENNSYTGFLSGLSANEKYKVRAYIRNGLIVKYGEVMEFTTLASNPSYSTVNFGNPGVNWSKYNLGATNGATPESWYGDYYQWGDNACCTNTGINCSWDSYRFSSGGRFTRYCPSDKTDFWYGYPATNPDNCKMIDDCDDCARQSLGGDWRLPTSEEWDLLYKYNTFEWLYVGSQSAKVPGFTAPANGYLVVKGGKYSDLDASVYMFLPAAGGRNGNGLDHVGGAGYYWSKTLRVEEPFYAYYMNFDSNGPLPQDVNHRFAGFSIRPVR